jgi:hypothetical protein
MHVDAWASLRHVAVAATGIFRNRRVASSIADVAGKATNAVAYQASSSIFRRSRQSKNHSRTYEKDITTVSRSK